MISLYVVPIVRNRGAACYDAVGMGREGSVCSGIIRENGSRNSQIVVTENHTGRCLPAFPLFKGSKYPRERYSRVERVIQNTQHKLC